MYRSLALFLITSTILATGWPLQAQQAQRPRIPAAEHINGKPVYDQDVMPVVESSLQRMWDTSDAVVDVQVISSEVRGVGSAPVYVRTFHTSKVLRVYTGDIEKGSTVVFTQAAGQLELPDMILRVAGAEALAPGERYVVFLRRQKTLGPWVLVGERDGAFKIRDGRIQPLGVGRTAAEQRGVTEQRFADELERVGRRGSRPKAF